MIDEDCPSDPHHEHVQATTILVSEERTDNHEKKKKKKWRSRWSPSPILNWFNDNDVSIEAHSFVTIPLETYHTPHVSPFQCLEEPSYV
jgi:hypothetical protein